MLASWEHSSTLAEFKLSISLWDIETGVRRDMRSSENRNLLTKELRGETVQMQKRFEQIH
jgi:hypothetical protein